MVTDLNGTVSDDNSGVDRARIYIRNINTNEFWNGTAWVPTWSWNLATLNGDNTWTLPSVELTQPGQYLVLMWAWDNNQNQAGWQTNPQPIITVN